MAARTTHETVAWTRVRMRAAPSRPPKRRELRATRVRPCPSRPRNCSTDDRCRAACRGSRPTGRCAAAPPGAPAPGCGRPPSGARPGRASSTSNAIKSPGRRVVDAVDQALFDVTHRSRNTASRVSRVRRAGEHSTRSGISRCSANQRPAASASARPFGRQRAIDVDCSSRRRVRRGACRSRISVRMRASRSRSEVEVPQHAHRVDSERRPAGSLNAEPADANFSARSWTRAAGGARDGGGSDRRPRGRRRSASRKNSPVGGRQLAQAPAQARHRLARCAPGSPSWASYHAASSSTFARCSASICIAARRRHRPASTPPASRQLDQCARQRRSARSARGRLPATAPASDETRLAWDAASSGPLPSRHAQQIDRVPEAAADPVPTAEPRR
jgi:hypothetical protein